MADANVLGSKGRVLFLRKYLEDHTDDNHVITTEELINLYKENGYKAQRQTIADDVAVLLSSGFDVIIEQIARNKTKTNAYHVGARLFELSELKMLADAVSSSRFITAEKSEILIHKLAELTNVENRESLTTRIHTASRMKTSNPNVFVNIDTIYRAIQHQKKISFHYWDYTPEKEKVLRHDGAEYIVSPYALIWDDDRYYVPSYSDSRQKIVHFRIDRMCDVIELDEQAFIDPTFNEAEYARKIIKMFDGDQQEQTVTLRCENDRMRNIIDRFGEDVPVTPVDDTSFRTEVNVVPSNTFFGWVMQYRGEILIERPVDVRQNYETMLKTILEKQAAAFPEEP